MKQTPEFLQMLAEAVTPLSLEISAGLLERPVPVSVGESAEIAALTELVQAMLDDITPELLSMFTTLIACNEEDIDDTIDEISEMTLDFVELARRVWSTPLLPQEEPARMFLAAIAEAPAVRVLAFCQRVIQAAVDPWAVMDNPEEPEIDLTVLLDTREEKANFAALLRRHPALQKNSPII